VISILQRGDGSIRRESASALFRISHLFLLFFILLIVSGCHYASGASTTLKDDGKAVFKRVAVFPFQRVSPGDVDVKTVRCPVCGLVFRTEASAHHAEKVVEELFLDRLLSQKAVAVIPPDRVGGIYERVTAGLFKADILEVSKKVGSELEADGVVVGYVYRYRERKGYSYSVEKPASVAFEIHLIRVRDGVVVWRGIFDKTQTSLTENIFLISSFFKQGGKWVTARELAAEGVDEILKDFPGLKLPKE